MAATFSEFQSPEEVGLPSPILNDIIYVLPKIQQSVNKILSSINLSKADEDARADLWRDETKYPDIDEMKFVCTILDDFYSFLTKMLQALSCIETEFKDELRNSGCISQTCASHLLTSKIVRKILKKPAAQYITKGQDEVGFTARFSGPAV